MSDSRISNSNPNPRPNPNPTKPEIWLLDVLLHQVDVQLSDLETLCLRSKSQTYSTRPTVWSQFIPQLARQNLTKLLPLTSQTKLTLSLTLNLTLTITVGITLTKRYICAQIVDTHK